MRLRSILLPASVCLLFGALIASSSANAASPGGRFTLPFAAAFGSTILPPGDYTFTVLSSFGSANYLDVRGKTTSVFILPAETHAWADGGKSRLTAVTLGNNHFIESLTLGEAGLTFRFKLPKGARVPASFTSLMAPAGQGS